MVEPSEGQQVSGGDGGDLKKFCCGAGDVVNDGGVRSISRSLIDMWSSMAAEGGDCITHIA